MKKIFYISIILSVTLLFNSCAESFLDQEVPLVASEEMIYSDAEKTELALLGLYSSLKGTNCNFMGGRTYVAFDNRGDDILNIDPNLVTLQDVYRLENVAPTATVNVDTWYYAYLAINRSNVFMESMEQYGTKDILGEAKYNQFVSEAKFVRALSYYYLVNLYAQPYATHPNAIAIPLRITAIKGSGQSDCPSSSTSAIYSAILADLSDGNIQALPNANNTYNATTRASQAAAKMLKMRALMATKDWSSAITVGESISGYELASNVEAQFAAPYYTKETIFALPQSTNDRPNTQRSCNEFYAKGNICVIDKTNGVMSKAEYSLAKDKRVIAFDDNGRLAKWDEGERLQWLPIFRYAETLLNLAECYVEMGATQETKARTALEKVRRRAIAETEDPINIDALSGNTLKEAITNEKRLEFIGEGMRGIEISRKGEAYIKGTEVNVAPGAGNYIWPFPQAERVNNSQWNVLAQ